MDAIVLIDTVYRPDSLRAIFKSLPDEVLQLLPDPYYRVSDVVSLKDFGYGLTYGEAHDYVEQSTRIDNRAPAHLFGLANQFHAGGLLEAGRFLVLGGKPNRGPSGSLFFPYVQFSPSGLTAGLKVETERLEAGDRVLVKRVIK